MLRLCRFWQFSKAGLHPLQACYNEGPSVFPRLMERNVKKIIWSIGFAWLLAVSSFYASAASEQVTEVVIASLDKGNDHGVVIESLMREPFSFSLIQATLAAVEAGGESESDAFAMAGIASATSLPEAEAVAAVLRSTDVDENVLDTAMEQYVQLMSQPFINSDAVDTPGGGGLSSPVSPAN